MGRKSSKISLSNEEKDYLTKITNYTTLFIIRIFFDRHWIYCNALKKDADKKYQARPNILRISLVLPSHSLSVVSSGGCPFSNASRSCSADGIA